MYTASQCAYLSSADRQARQRTHCLQSHVSQAYLLTFASDHKDGVSRPRPTPGMPIRTLNKVRSVSQSERLIK
jgi:hypothetical protein